MTDLLMARRTWDTLAARDPYHAILTDPRYADTPWPVEAFLATGESDVHEIMADLARVGLMPPATPTRPEETRALDLGCGLGRLTAPLARYCGSAVGVDLSPVMAAKATALWAARWEPRTFADLTFLPLPLDAQGMPSLPVLNRDGYDLITSFITLQHVERLYQRALLGEMARALAPGGALWVQLMLPPLEPWAIQPWEDGVMEMHGLAVSDAIREVRGGGATAVDFHLHPGQSAWHPAWVSYVLIARR